MNARVSSSTVECFFRTDKPRTVNQFKEQYCLNLPVAALKSGKLTSTHQLFDEIPLTDTFAWNNLIQTHLSSGNFEQALSTYSQMLLRGVRPDRHTLPRVLTAARLSGTLFFGKQLHGQASKLGFSSDHYVFTALIEMYGHLDGADAAKWLFDKSLSRNWISLTLLVRLYVKEGKLQFAIDLFNHMVDSGAEMDGVALATAMGACGQLKSLRDARNVHHIARKCGLEFDVLVSNSLLKMYLDCGSIRDAREVFDGITSKDAISWTAMIRGYVNDGGFNEGLKLFRQMNSVGVKPDALTFSSVLPACARMAAHKHGKEIHGCLLRNSIGMNVILQNALMDMYLKSGSVEYASKIFAVMKNKDIVSWTVMILGYSFHGRGDLGVDLFRKMLTSSGIEIDQIAYEAVLYACCSACMVENGKFYFDCLGTPKVSNCTLMVALLARAGLFHEARAFIEERKIARHAEVLRALLGGCRIHQNTILGKQVIEQLCDLEPLNANNYVLLSNWYAHYAKWDMVNKWREAMSDMGLKPKKAYSWIELRGKVHVFGTGDVSHPRSEGIYWELQSLMKKIDERIENVSDFSLHDVDEERECVPIGHSEMLAISFGLISTQADSKIRVTKNLRVCRNCHASAKVISEIVGREIIIKDPSCFHHFKDGSCSCGDF